jgi:hypothetical protein
MVQAGGGPPQSALIRRDSRTLRHWVSGKPVEDPPKDKAGNLLLAGAAAGGVSKFCTAPIDRVKLMYQVSPDRVFSVSAAMSTAQRIVHTSGVMGLWRGNSIAVLRDVPYAAIIFSSYASNVSAFRCKAKSARSRPLFWLESCCTKFDVSNIRRQQRSTSATFDVSNI